MARRHQRRRANAGFSLVEVAMALAIFGFVYVALIGSLSLSLDSVKESRGDTRASHIARASLTTIQAELSTHDDFMNPPSPWQEGRRAYWFNRNAMLVDDPSEALYRVDARIVDADSLHTSADVVRPLVLEIRSPVDPATGESLTADGERYTLLLRNEGYRP